MDVLAAATQTWWQNLLVAILPVIFLALVSPLIAYIVALLRKKKVKVEFDMADSLAKTAYFRAEQWWKVKLNDGAEPKDKAAETMAMATTFLKASLEQWNLPKMAKEKLIALIESKVGEINSAKTKADG